ncbi:putative transporter [Magnetofaba australis IT-1]|uniref:Putative transporter n=2 Tax=Magnetofaba TaxID=1472292 RepID=A0A1Y2K4Y1_9PROT|nr:putative transporter [Magnetofaba australis IT-1]
MLLLPIGGLLVLLALSGFFSSSETALFSLDAIQLERMKQAGHPRLALIRRLLGEPRRLIVTILIGNELVNVAASNISASLVMRVTGDPDNWWVNICIMLPLLLLLGEITPKTLAVRDSERIASLVCRPIDWFSRLIGPLRYLVRAVSDLLITMLVGDRRSQGNIVTEDLVRTLAEEAAESGALQETEKEYIHNIIEFGNQTVEEVMTPRSNMASLNIDASFEEALTLLREERASRVPVYGEEPDEVVGVLYYRDLMGADLSGYEGVECLRGLLRKPFLVPESKPVVDLFHDFRERKLTFALVLDEYGGITGLVTMEDLLASIFGESYDPEDPDHDASAEALDEDCFRLDGNLDVEQANALLGATFDTEVADTMAGLLLHTHGELPNEGEIIQMDTWCFQVTRLEGNRIEEALAARAEEGADPESCRELLEQVAEADGAPIRSLHSDPYCEVVESAPTAESGENTTAGEESDADAESDPPPQSAASPEDATLVESTQPHDAKREG